MSEDLAKILVVDDISANRLLLKRMLRNLPCEIIAVDSGYAALEEINSTQFALLLLDIRMPGIDGFELAEQLQRTSAAATPIIFITASLNGEISMIRGYELGAVDFMCKPVDEFILRSKVKVFLELYQLQSQHRQMLEKEIAIRTQQLQQAKEEAELANATKSRFIANVSHELRTPLHAVLSFSEMGLKKGASNSVEKNLRYFDRIAISARRQLQLVNNLLSVTALEAGTFVVKPRRHDLRECITALLSEAESLLQQKQLRAELHLPQDPCFAMVDDQALSQIFFNLLCNAVKFSPDAATIQLVLSQEEGMWQVAVVDEGEGIPSTELQTIFEPYVQVSTQDYALGGTGLGLSIVRELVTLHQGSAFARNRSDRSGAMVCFTLPVAD